MRGLLAALAFFAGPAALVAGAVWLRLQGEIEGHHVVESRMRSHLAAAERASRESGVPLPLVLAVASVESSGRAGAVSPAGAVGLMQLMPSTAAQVAAELGVRSPDLKDAATSLRLGARYLAGLLRTFGGREHGESLALCAYNAGPGAVGAWLADGAPPSSSAGFSGWVRYGETRAFVRRVGEWRVRWEASLPAR
ncbi:MAG: Soluble lytic murein transglycosylase [Planctomycetes bacterium]|nr:Soluble lytic murein transglycosylase [Planctomycetota bacterium]